MQKEGTYKNTLLACTPVTTKPTEANNTNSKQQNTNTKIFHHE